MKIIVCGVNRWLPTSAPAITTISTHTHARSSQIKFYNFTLLISEHMYEHRRRAHMALMLHCCGLTWNIKKERENAERWATLGLEGGGEILFILPKCNLVKIVHKCLFRLTRVHQPTSPQPTPLAMERQTLVLISDFLPLPFFHSGSSFFTIRAKCIESFRQ